MSETLQTESRPVVAVEGPDAPKATKTITVARRKVLQGKHKQIGAPRLDVIGLTKNRKRGAFTKQDIFDLNGQTISPLTITHRIADLCKANELVLMTEKAKHTGPGRPKEQFNFDLTKAAPKKSRKGKGKGKTETAPVVPTEPQPAEAPAPEPAPAPAETAV